MVTLVIRIVEEYRSFWVRKLQICSFRVKLDLDFIPVKNFRAFLDLIIITLLQFVIYSYEHLIGYSISLMKMRSF